MGANVPERFRQERPRAMRGQGVSGIQSGKWRLVLVGLDSRHAVPRPRWGLAARKSDSTRE
jgi:hypothetical protein